MGHLSTTKTFSRVILNVPLKNVQAQKRRAQNKPSSAKKTSEDTASCRAAKVQLAALARASWEPPITAPNHAQMTSKTCKPLRERQQCASSFLPTYLFRPALTERPALNPENGEGYTKRGNDRFAVIKKTRLNIDLKVWLIQNNFD